MGMGDVRQLLAESGYSAGAASRSAPAAGSNSSSKSVAPGPVYEPSPVANSHPAAAPGLLLSAAEISSGSSSGFPLSGAPLSSAASSLAPQSTAHSTIVNNSRGALGAAVASGTQVVPQSAVNGITGGEALPAAIAPTSTLAAASAAAAVTTSANASAVAAQQKYGAPVSLLAPATQQQYTAGQSSSSAPAAAAAGATQIPTSAPTLHPAPSAVAHRAARRSRGHSGRDLSGDAQVAVGASRTTHGATAASVSTAATAFPSDDIVVPSSGHRPPTDADLDLESILTSFGLDKSTAEYLGAATQAALGGDASTHGTSSDSSPSSSSFTAAAALAPIDRARALSRAGPFVHGSNTNSATANMNHGGAIVVPGVGSFASAAAMLDEADALVRKVLGGATPTSTSAANHPPQSHAPTSSSSASAGGATPGLPSSTFSSGATASGSSTPIYQAQQQQQSQQLQQATTTATPFHAGTAPQVEVAPPAAAAPAEDAGSLAVDASSSALHKATAREVELLATGNFSVVSPLAMVRAGAAQRRSGLPLTSAATDAVLGGGSGAQSAAQRRRSSVGSAFDSASSTVSGSTRTQAQQQRGEGDGAGGGGDETASIHRSGSSNGAKLLVSAAAAPTASQAVRPKTLLSGGRYLLAEPGSLESGSADPSYLLLLDRQGQQGQRGSLGRSAANVLNANDVALLLRHMSGGHRGASSADSSSVVARKTPPVGVFPSFIEGHRSASGVLKVERLGRVSDALRVFAAAQQQQQQASSAAAAGGPGQPTSLAVHPKFIAVGTARGLLLLFDHFGELKTVLARIPLPAQATGASAAVLVGSAVATLTAASGASDGAVTSIDVCATLDYVAAGYFSGRVALFDVANITKCSVVKVAEHHRAPITALRFVSPSEPRILTIDASGTVNFLFFSRFMSIRWGVECR